MTSRFSIITPSERIAQYAVITLSELPPRKHPWNRSPVTNDQIAEAYSRLGNVWKVGEELGLSGQTVSERMKAAGIEKNKRWLTERDREIIRAFYESTPPDTFDLDFLARLIDRTKPLVCREARDMGFTTQKRARSQRTREAIPAMRKRVIAEKGHPRGALGLKHTDEAKRIIGLKSRQTWATWKTFGIGQMSDEARDARALASSRRSRTIPAQNAYSRCKGGYRDDLPGIYFRSAWEANYARYLNKLKSMNVVESWAYEPKTFWFDGIKRGVMSYKPDFCVVYKGDPKEVYVEIKGWQTPKDRTKWRRMAKYHPEIKLEIVGEKQYLALKRKWATAVPNWEMGAYRNA